MVGDFHSGGAVVPYVKRQDDDVIPAEIAVKSE